MPGWLCHRPCSRILDSFGICRGYQSYAIKTAKNVGPVNIVTRGKRGGSRLNCYYFYIGRGLFTKRYCLASYVFCQFAIISDYFRLKKSFLSGSIDFCPFLLICHQQKRLVFSSFSIQSEKYGRQILFKLFFKSLKAKWQVQSLSFQSQNVSFQLSVKFACLFYRQCFWEGIFSVLRTIDSIYISEAAPCARNRTYPEAEKRFLIS